jgi:chaperonin cofactor prefoldin
MITAVCMTSQPPLANTLAAAEASKAKPADDKPAPAKEGTANLPLKRVVLFSSGVGYFEHNGKVTDNAKVDLKFKVKDINDLLKSMVVQDFDGGHVSTVGYGSNDPLDKRLSSFAINLNGNPTLAQLLEQIRGEKVETDAPNRIVGTIVSIEKRRTEISKEHFIDETVMNVATDGGLRSVILENAGSIRLLNPTLDAELRKALGVLATAHETDKKTVSLDFRGEGQRNVRVGYVEETPIWKTSYRLVLSDDKKPFLQGWAVVENPSEEDWNEVQLSLVSGRPISFTMNLYQPTYIPRPQAYLELFSSLGPQSYEQDLARRDMEFRQAADGMTNNAGVAMAGAPAGAPAARRAMGGAAGGAVGMGGVARSAPAAPPAFSPAGSAAYPGEPMNLSQGVESAATAGNVGELFQYAIRTPVTLSRHESAMLPILNSDVKAEKFSIYNPAVQAKHPLNGLKLTNSTDLHLMQGPITVFDGDTYAGDALIQDIPPGSERLLSYALDLDTEVAPLSKGHPEQITSIRIAKGTLIIDRKFTRSQEYTVKNSGKKAKKVLIEYALDPNWKLVSPKEPAEKTRDKYRFAVDAKPGEPAKLTVEEERTEPQVVALNNLDDNTISFYIRSNKLSEKVLAALNNVVKQKQAIQDLVQKRGKLEKDIRTISEDQPRIRANMDKLDKASDLYKVYITELSEQEDQIKKLRPQIKELQDRENELRKSLEDFLLGLEAR